jgi:SAM-dependent methyltransferase
MTVSQRCWALLWPLLLALLCGCSTLNSTAIAPDSNSLYQTRPASADGIGKVYMGREIAQVMGYKGAYWLERSGRGLEERPQRAIEALDLKPTDVVADIGAGTGYFSFRISPLVPEGQVLAVDIQPEMLEILQERSTAQGIPNIKPILGTPTDPNLPPNSVDLALMVDAYHEFEYPHEMMSAIAQAIKPGGSVVLAEYRGENPLIPIKRLHKMTQRQVRRELEAVGLTWQKTDDRLPQQHLLFFQKPPTPITP